MTRAKLLYWAAGSAAVQKAEEKLRQLKARHPRTNFVLARGTAFRRVGNSWDEQAKIFTGAVAIFLNTPKLVDSYGDPFAYFRGREAFEPVGLLDLTFRRMEAA